ncbi:MAG: hypothetical protein OXI57_01735 [Rhodospirillales bacterium]|nr:hypothetical protein [Rhodospirillales bacterium]
MSLKKQVENPSSPLGGFLRQAFAAGSNRRVLAEINGHLDSHPAICRLESGTPPAVRRLIGHAVDYRIRYHFAITPSSEFTVARNGAWAVTRVDDLVDLARSDPSRFSDYAITQFGSAPDGDEDWQHFSDTKDGYHTVWIKPGAGRESLASLSRAWSGAILRGFAAKKLPLDCTLELFDLLDRTVGSLAAHHRRPTGAEECRLARLCLVLAIFESIGRGGRGWPAEFLDGRDVTDPERLLNAIPRAWVEDVAVLAATFRHRHADWQGMPATLNPVFAGARDVGGADGDLIVDGCLWEIKTTIQRAQGKWLLQLLGYALLDYDDEYAIGHAGFLFPRKGACVRWTLPDLLRELSGRGDVSIAGLRHDLRRKLRSNASQPA